MQLFLFYTTVTVFYWKNKYSKVVNGNVHGTSTRPSCRTSQGPNDGTFYVFKIQPRNILNLLRQVTQDYSELW